MIEIFILSVAFSVLSIVIDALKQPDELLSFLTNWERRLANKTPYKSLKGWRKFMLKGWLVCVKCRAGQLALFGVPLVCWIENVNYFITFHLLGIAIAVFVGWYYSER